MSKNSRGNRPGPDAIVKTQDGRARTNPPVSDVQTTSAKVQRTNAEFRAELYAGQIPHPDHLERFEELSPGATDRFIGMAEKQSAHRQGMERKFLNFNGISQVLGVVFAGLIVMGAIALGGYLVYNDKSLQGFVAMFVPLATVGGLFIHDRRQQQKELERKRASERR